ncbi:MAG: fused MFS/spermidine synthase [Pseudomonadota bacterium]|jgi:spermidine synthase
MARDDDYELRQSVPPERLSGRPYLKDEADELALHFDFRTVQSTMSKADPTALTLGYTRSMMGFLLLHPEPARIAMIGLGGGSLAKYCLQRLPGVDFTAVEIDPAVIALRDEFRLPPDGDNFRVVCADGADYIRAMEDSVDVLLIDGFCLDGLPRQLCTTAFYDYCYARLKPGGVMVVNLWAGDDLLQLYLGRLRQCFDGRVLLIDAQEEGNQIAFACKQEDFPPSLEQLRSRSNELAPAHPIDLPDTAARLRRALEGRRKQRGRGRST